MTDDTTPPPQPDDAFLLAPSSDPEAYYDKLYAPILKDATLGLMPAVVYGALRGMARRSGVATASNATIAAMTTLSVPTVERAIRALKEQGVVVARYSQTQQGKARVITFPPLSTIYPKNRNHHTEGSATLTQRDNDLTADDSRSQSTTTTLSDAREGDGGGGFSDAPSSNGKPPENRAQRDSEATGDGVPNQIKSAMEREKANPYWAEHEARRKLFNACFEAYPKKIDVIQAMVAWRATIAERMETTPDMDRQVWNGLHAWVAYWKEANTALQHIPSFANWIKHERWEGAPLSGAAR